MPLHRQILIALLVGMMLAAGLNYVEPATKALTLEITRVIGNLFLNALKAVALPLVVVTLIAGIGNLNQRLGRLGALAISFYGLSTLLAVLVGLLVVNLMAPGLHATAPAGGWLASAAGAAGDNATDGAIDDWTDQAEQRVWFLGQLLR